MIRLIFDGVFDEGRHLSGRLFTGKMRYQHLEGNTSTIKTNTYTGIPVEKILNDTGVWDEPGGFSIETGVLSFS